MGFTVKKGSEKGSQKGFSEKGISRRCLERPFEEYAPLGERPRFGCSEKGWIPQGVSLQ